MSKGLTLAAIEGEILPDEQCFHAKLRAAVFDGISEQDVKEVVQTIVAKAKAGDTRAQKVFFDHILGGKVKPTQITVNNHFESVEQGAEMTRNRRRDVG
jgi:hypothetical protein